MSDHAGVTAKAALARHLEAEGHVVLDLGTDSAASVDYPDFASKGGRAVAAGEGERGVFLCGTGIGVCMAANKVPGIRAAVVYDEASAEMSRRLYLLEKEDLPAAMAWSRNAQRLLANLDLAEDVAFCLQRDQFNLVAELQSDGCVRRRSQGNLV